MDVRMSPASLILSIILYIIASYQAAQIAAGFMAKYDVSQADSFIESNSPNGLDVVDVYTAQEVILKLHPSLKRLVDLVEVQDPNNSELYFDDLHATLNLNLGKSLAWLLGSVLICGIPAFLLGKRRERYSERRMGSRSSRRNRR